MKNKILWSTLATILCIPAYAETTSPTNPIPPTTQAVTTAQTGVSPTLDCQYKIDAKTKVLDPSLVQTWAKQATLKTFDLDSKNLDEQMKNLHYCFTDQGWTGFNNALTKSGNLEAIKGQQLTVTSQIDGPIHMDDIKDKVWKLTIPIQVTYQNEKEHITQLLSVHLTVGRKMTGNLGITQMIATPRTNPENTSAAPSKNTDASSAPQTSVTPK